MVIFSLSPVVRYVAGIIYVEFRLSCKNISERARVKVYKKMAACG